MREARRARPTPREGVTQLSNSFEVLSQIAFDNINKPGVEEGFAVYMKSRDEALAEL